MASNLRAKPIEGHVTDSAGNILRNARIVVKQVTPQASYIVDSVNSDDSGYFKTKPIQNGSYDIYESGIVIAKTIHNPDNGSIQAFKAYQDNINVESIESFDTLAEDNRLSDFKAFIQIESQEIDVEQYGNLFPIYDIDITHFVDSDDELWNMSQYFGFSNQSRITTTRFDVEYFTPLTAISQNYLRIKWVGVPAIKFSEDSKLVIPLDYFSIVPNHPKEITPNSGTFPGTEVTFSYVNTDSYTIEAESNSEFNNLLKQMKKGDILKCILDGYSEDWYGIVTDYTITTAGGTIQLETFRSSRYRPTPAPLIDYDVTKLYSYDGMFRNISEIDEEVNERFTVTENNYAQNNSAEIYNYNYRFVTP